MVARSTFLFIIIMFISGTNPLLVLLHSYSAYPLVFVHHSLGCVLTTLGLLVQVSEPTSNVAFGGVSA